MRKAATARLFAALLPPPECTHELAAWARSELAGPGCRLLPPESMHLTISFLGERPVGELDALRGALEGLEVDSPELHLGAPVLLPPRNPRTVAVEIIDASGALVELQRTTTAALAAASAWEPPRRRFRPHITLARVRRDHAPQPPFAPTPSLGFHPLALELLRSHLLPDGAVYEPLATKLLHTDEDASKDPGSVRLNR